jgi:hypothetical protein
MSKNIIYALVEPWDQHIIRYIGKSSTGLRRPKSEFCNSRLVGNSHKENWIKSRIANGYTDRMQYIVILEEYPDDITKEQLNNAEISFISEYRAKGFDLTNATNGGDGVSAGKDHPLYGKKRDPKIVEKIAKSNRKPKKVHPWNFGKKGVQVVWNKNKPWSKEFRQSISGEKSSRGKLTQRQADEIRELYDLFKAAKISDGVIGDIYGISATSVHSIIINQTYVQEGII